MEMDRLSNPAESNPGASLGKVICVKILEGLAPRSAAASSRVQS